MYTIMYIKKPLEKMILTIYLSGTSKLTIWTSSTSKRNVDHNVLGKIFTAKYNVPLENVILTIRNYYLNTTHFKTYYLNIKLILIRYNKKFPKYYNAHKRAFWEHNINHKKHQNLLSMWTSCIMYIKTYYLNIALIITYICT